MKSGWGEGRGKGQATLALPCVFQSLVFKYVVVPSAPAAGCTLVYPLLADPVLAGSGWERPHPFAVAAGV